MKNDLLENVNQAEKILRNINYDLTNRDYIKIKEQLTKNNQIGYLGFVVSLSINSNKFDYRIAQRLTNFITKHKQIIKQLPKPLINYNSIDEIINDLKFLRRKSYFIKFANQLTNKPLKNEIKTSIDRFVNEEKNVIYFMNLPKSEKREFLVKTDKFQNTGDLFNALDDFITDHKEGFNFENVYNTVKSIDDSSAKILFLDKDKGYMLVRIYDYEASKTIGSKAWCIVGDKEVFQNYTENGKALQYFLFNFNPSAPPEEKMLAFTINQYNEIVAAHDRYDNEFPEIKETLNNWGVSEKIYYFNSREYTNNQINDVVKFNDNDDDNYWNRTIKHEENEQELTIPKNTIRHATYFFKEFIENNKNKNIDLILKGFQNYEMQIIRKKPNEIRNDVSIKKINILPQIIGYLNKQSDDRKIFVDFFKKAISSNVNLNTNTKRSILHYLKDSGLDILSFVKNLKNKKDISYTDSEVGVLAKRGDDLKPMIANKLAKFRRGEDITLTPNEIKYAIDNGYKKIIQHYYQKSIPQYLYEPLDYDDMVIYKKLGLFNQIEDIIYKKGKNFGVDSLNSIEKSIFDMKSNK